MTKRIIMLDIETLGVDHTAIAWHVGLVGVNADAPDEYLDPPVNSFLPIVPQQNLIPERKIDGLTVLYWMDLPDDARKAMQNCNSTDFDEFASLIRHFIRAFLRMTDNGKADYELVTRGKFDVPIMESIIKSLGLEIPWQFRNFTDLRTLMRYAGLNVSDVPEPVGFIKHNAYWDCIFQLSCYFEAVKLLRSK